MKTITMNVTDEQALRVEALRKTTMSGEVSATPKSVQEMLYSVIEKGLYAIEYNRKQYQRKNAALRVYKLAQKDRELAVRLGLATQAVVGVESDEEEVE